MIAEATLVKVIDLADGREIAWGGGMTERLKGRVDEVRQAVAEGVAAIASGLAALPKVEGWQAQEVSASFGIGIVAETGIVLTKASGEATFEVSVTYRRAE